MKQPEYVEGKEVTRNFERFAIQSFRLAETAAVGRLFYRQARSRNRYSIGLCRCGSLNLDAIGSVLRIRTRGRGATTAAAPAAADQDQEQNAKCCQLQPFPIALSTHQQYSGNRHEAQAELGR